MGPAFLRKYAVGADGVVYFSIRVAGSPNFAAGGDWTPVTGDVKISIDGGTQVDIDASGGALPAYSEGSWVFTFTNAQLTGKKVSVRIVDSATKAVDDCGFEIETFGHASALYPTDFSAAVLPVDAIQISGDVAPADGLEFMFDGTGGGPTLRIQHLIVQPATGIGITLSAAANEPVIEIAGAGVVAPVYIHGASSAAAIQIVGGGSDGAGVIISGGGFGKAVRYTGGVEGTFEDLDTMQASIASMDGRLPADPSDASVIAAAFTALNDLSSAEVLAVITQALRTDSGTELSGIPAKDAPLAVQIQLLFQSLRNGYAQTPTAFTIYNDAGVAIGTALVSSAPALVSRGKLA